MIPVLIPTHLREHDQITFRRLPPIMRQHTYLMTHDGRAATMRTANANPCAGVVDLGKTDGIADVRQKCLEWAYTKGFYKVLMLDDGCYFYRRDGFRGGKPQYRGMDEVLDWKQLVQTLERLLDKYPQVGISAKQGNHLVETDHKVVGRCFTAYALNVRALRKLGVRFDSMYRANKQVKLYEDFNLTLELLTRGIPNAVLHTFCINAQHGRNGGNTTFRTNSTQHQCALALQRRFPRYVKVVQKATKAFKLAGSDTHRWDVTIQWKKAFDFGTVNKQWFDKYL